MLKQIWNHLFPPTTAHLWSYGEAHGIETRACSICGRREELDIGGGHMGPMWMVEKHGDKALHFIKQPSRRKL